MPLALDQHKIAFFNVPKVATTSIKEIFYRVEHGRAFDPKNHGGRHIHQVMGSGARATEEMFARFQEYWRFTVVRDPMKRILSCYANRIAHHNDLGKDFRISMKFRMRGLPPRPSLDRFIKDLDRYRKYSRNIEHHTDSIKTFVGSDLSRLDAVYPIEQLAELTAELSRRIGQTVSMPHKETGGPKFTLADLNDQSYRKLVAFTAPEYELLKDFYPPPPATRPTSSRTRMGA